MKRYFLLAVGAAIAVGTAFAAQLELPHRFTAGTPARAAEVNANFESLSQESNAQDVRVSALEQSHQVASEQMICMWGNFQATQPPAYFSCRRASDPTTLIRTSYADVVAEGWKAISVGGDGGNSLMLIFELYSSS